MHILGAIAEFERERIRERVMAGLQRTRTQGRRLGRPHAVVPTVRVHSVTRLLNLPTPAFESGPGNAERPRSIVDAQAVRRRGADSQRWRFEDRATIRHEGIGRTVGDTGTSRDAVPGLIGVLV